MRIHTEKPPKNTAQTPKKNRENLRKTRDVHTPKNRNRNRRARATKNRTRLNRGGARARRVWPRFVVARIQ